MTPEDPLLYTPPESFGPFHVLRQIGAGVLGPVFATKGPGAGRLIAVKVFRLDITSEQVSALAVELERLVALELDHPAIVRPIAAGLEGGVAYLAQAWIEANSLDIRDRDGAPSESEVLHLIARVADALDCAALAGAHHGSLHPRDVLVATGEPHVTGFGVTEALQRIGVRVPGRRQYGAPERIAGVEWTRAADQYALAAIAHELLFGRHLPDDPIEAVASLSAIDRVDQARFQEVFTRAFAVDPASRFPRAGLLAEALAQGAFAEELEHTIPVPRRVRVSVEKPGASAAAVASAQIVPSADSHVRAEPRPEPPDHGGWPRRHRDEEMVWDLGHLGEKETTAGSIEWAAADDDRVEGPAEAALMIDSGPEEESPARFLAETALPDDDELGRAALRTAERVGTDAESWEHQDLMTVASPSAGDQADPATAQATRMMEWVPEGDAEPARFLNEPDVTEDEGQGDATLPFLAVLATANRLQATLPLIAMLITGLGIGALGGYQFAANIAEVAEPPRRMTEVQVPSDRSQESPSRSIGMVGAVSQPEPRPVSLSGTGPALLPDTRPVLLSDTRPTSTVRRSSSPPLRRAGTPSSRFLGSLSVVTKPKGASVFVDGQLVGTTPLAMPRVNAGSHVVRLELAGYRRRSSTVRVVTGQLGRVIAFLDLETSP